MINYKTIKYFLMASALLLTLPLGNVKLSAQNLQNRFFFAYNYENITVDNTVGGKRFTLSIVNSVSEGPANLVTFTIACASGTDCPIRMTMDGTAPTTSVGMRAVYGQSISLFGVTNIRAFRAIREGATSAVINVQFWR